MTNFIKQTALEIGFDACGIAKAEFLNEDAEFLKKWLSQNLHGEMSYLERNFEKRTDPRLIVEGCKSIIVTLLNYYPSQKQTESAPKISKYAYSKIDYHTIIKEKLYLLEQKISEKYGEDCFNSKFQHRFVDSAPVFERRWAERAGLGWIGRNKMLINPILGSFCFIGILMINKELYYDKPMKDGCGRCTKCIDACPTQALVLNKGIDASKCISYQTIEKKGEIDTSIQPKLSGYVFGCDICNDVCPWNKTRPKPHQHKDLIQLQEIIDWQNDDWANLTEDDFNRLFKNSAILRAGYKKLKQNIELVQNQAEKGETNNQK